MKTCKERMTGEEIEIREENRASGDSKHGEREREGDGLGRFQKQRFRDTTEGKTRLTPVHSQE